MWHLITALTQRVNAKPGAKVEAAAIEANIHTLQKIVFLQIFFFT